MRTNRKWFFSFFLRDRKSSDRFGARAIHKIFRSSRFFSSLSIRFWHEFGSGTKAFKCMMTAPPNRLIRTHVRKRGSINPACPTRLECVDFRGSRHARIEWNDVNFELYGQELVSKGTMAFEQKTFGFADRFHPHICPEQLVFFFFMPYFLDLNFFVWQLTINLSEWPLLNGWDAEREIFQLIR